MSDVFSGVKSDMLPQGDNDRQHDRERMRRVRAELSPEEQKDQRERDRERKRRARARLSPEEQKDRRERNRERMRSVRKALSPEEHERQQELARERMQKARKAAPLKPFIGVDGEGIGNDSRDRQNYVLMCAASASEAHHTMHQSGRALSVTDCLEYILSLPKNAILVGFSIGYDANQIIRGIKPDRWGGILDPRQGKNGPCYTWWGDYAIIYQKGQFLRVARIDRSGYKPAILKHSSRSIYDVFGFFGCSFVKAIENWNIGTPDERALIVATKPQRGEFDRLTPEIIEYCQTECRLLSQLMAAFREACYAVNIHPQQWSGAGWLADAMYKNQGAPKRPQTKREVDEAAERAPAKSVKTPALRRPARPEAFEIAAAAAYYGGRFEVSQIGHIDGPVHEYDLHSAYPSAMLDVPCPMHTEWEHRPGANTLPRSSLFVARVLFEHPDRIPWCGLRFRRKGNLIFPRQGTGWYWSVEIDAMRRHLKGKIRAVFDLWVARRRCDCPPIFGWIPEVYDERRRLDAVSPNRGIPLKLGLNSLYGKAAQRSGRAPYHDAVTAGLATAITRARLVEALVRDPESVVMLATDALYSTRPLFSAAEIGDGLGQWAMTTLPDLFIAQPGVYWSPSNHNVKLKTRGVPRSVIGKAAPDFTKTFDDWITFLHQPGALETCLNERLFPEVPIKLRVFYGCRLARARRKPWLAGKWDNDVTRYESFDWQTKRDPYKVTLLARSLLTAPITQNPFSESEGYRPADFDRLVKIGFEGDGVAEEVNDDMLFEAQSDHTPFLPSDE